MFGITSRTPSRPYVKQNWLTLLKQFIRVSFIFKQLRQIFAGTGFPTKADSNALISSPCALRFNCTKKAIVIDKKRIRGTSNFFHFLPHFFINFAPPIYGGAVAK